MADKQDFAAYIVRKHDIRTAVEYLDWLFRQYLRAIKDLPDNEMAATELTVMQLAAWAKDQVK